MKKRIALGVAACIIVGVNLGQPSKINYGLPDLHQIKLITLSPSYSCRPPEEFKKGYEKTALFLSDYSKKRNSYDLLFDGGCRSEDTFDVPDMSLIADLGEPIYLEDISAHLAFNVTQKYNGLTKFERQAKVQIGHTYAVVINERERRGLFIFTVVNHTRNEQVEIKYAVKAYQLLNVVAESSGFEWERKSTQ